MKTFALSLLAVCFLNLSAVAQAQLSAGQLKVRAETYQRLVTEVITNTGRGDGLNQAEMLASGVEALYRHHGKVISKELKQRLSTVRSGDPERTLEWALLQLGDIPGLTLGQAVMLTINHARQKTDPTSGLVFQNAMISSPTGLSVGFELEGITLQDRIVYHMDSLNLDGQNHAAALRPPVGPIWTVSRVIPGSPAADAGMMPGDRIIKVDDVIVTQDNYAKIYTRLIKETLQEGNNQFEVPVETEGMRLTVTSPKRKSEVNITLSRSPYTPTVFHAPRRTETGEPNFWLDEKAKIACIRVGAVELNSERDFIQIIENLREDDVRGLILDLRWCPGGYVTPTTILLSQFLPSGTILSQLRPIEPVPPQVIPQTERSSGSIHPRWEKIPLAVLVHGDTVGGGEMIAATLQDHKRAIVMGQRTFGKANIMQALPISIPGLSYRYTTGYSQRPNGNMRHRFPDSKVDDPWGVKPNRGYEIPGTVELSRATRLQTELLAIRPPRARTALLLDDPDEDGQRLVALQLFKKYLAELQSATMP